MAIKKTSHLTLLPLLSSSLNSSGAGGRPALLSIPAPPSPSSQLEILLPPQCSFSPGPYFHQSHEETLEVLEGRLEVTLSGRKIVLKKGASVVVERGVVVDWRRSEDDKEAPCKIGLRWQPEYVSLLLLSWWTYTDANEAVVLWQRLQGRALLADLRLPDAQFCPFLRPSFFRRPSLPSQSFSKGHPAAPLSLLSRPTSPSPPDGPQPLLHSFGPFHPAHGRFIDARLALGHVDGSQLDGRRADGEGSAQKGVGAEGGVGRRRHGKEGPLSDIDHVVEINPGQLR